MEKCYVLTLSTRNIKILNRPLIFMIIFSIYIFKFRSRSSVMGQNDSEEVVKLHHEVIEQAKYQGPIFL